ncbi:glycoside hydrolase family 16 protein [Crucibulum laeve]|uniref:Glycoside hydrolase family 16 protein n=1 Tax=Crucibulum laeve TaxID=68775 RepID=A0A5C3LXA1_9AGAR|nr:glycoside hydrolase family 16 protein [Crucibulum laeve]
MQHGDGSGSVTPPNGSSNSLYRNSAAGNMMSGVDTGAGNGGAIPRTSSTQTFRAPFLSPASRPTSSLWAPPSYSQQLMSNGNGGVYSPNASSSALPYPALPKKAPLPSTRLAAPIAKSDKPWLAKPDPRARLSWWLTLFCIFIGIGGAAVLCWQGVASVQKIDPSRLCSVLNEDFSGSSLDESVWNREIELGGFGNGEFQMTTGDSDNLYLQNSQLYIHPTLTSDKVQNVLDGGNFTLQDCTRTDNRTACSASSSNSRGTVINPIQSARINTKGKKSIRYGKVEIKAKMPKGDWLWPAVWMLPENNTYGAWPASGEIDIIEARGNGPDYPAQGSNFMRSTLNYGPIPAVIKQIFGWQSLKRSSFDKDFHIYGLEWDEQFMRFYVDSRIHAMLDLNLKAKKDSFWERGSFPQTAQNGSAQVVVPNPYENRPNSAPFDQPFYLIINLAAGGTSGWFPDNKGNKPWFDGSLTAMRDFAKAQDSWLPTWPSSAEDRSFRIDYVKMWELC